MKEKEPTVDTPSSRDRRRQQADSKQADRRTRGVLLT